MRVSHTKIPRTFNINILDEIAEIRMAFALSHFDLFIFFYRYIQWEITKSVNVDRSPWDFDRCVILRR